MFGFYRLYLAVVVALYHYFDLPAVGLWAVVSFFILSGFLMTMIMNEGYGYDANGFRRYASNRWLRLFPSYYFVLTCTVASLLIIPAADNHLHIPNTVSEVIANLTMIFPSFSPVEYFPRLIFPTWALTIEIFFYLLIGIGLSKTPRLTVAWFLASIGYVVVSSILANSLPNLDYGNVIQASLPFSLGAVIYHYKDLLYKAILTLRVVRLPWLIGLFLVNQLATIIGYKLIGEEAWKIAFFGSYISLILSCVLVLMLFYQDAASNLKRLDDVMGQYSYPIYLTHSLGAILAVRILNIDTISERGLIFFIVASVFAVLLSVICVHVIDNNVEKVRKRIKTKAS